MNPAPHVLHELSEYLDGESRDPERIARHLQSCPECARRQVELLKLSGHLKALRGPEVHPAFVTRVMAHTAETPRTRAWFPRMTPRIAAVLCIAGLATASAWRWIPDTPGDAPAPDALTPKFNVAWQDDAQVVEALGRLLDNGAPVDLFGDLDEPADAEEAAVALDSILESLAEASPDEDFVDPFDREDLTGLMDSLAGEDVQLLSDLLETHGNEV